MKRGTYDRSAVQVDMLSLEQLLQLQAKLEAAQEIAYQKQMAKKRAKKLEIK